MTAHENQPIGKDEDDEIYAVQLAAKILNDSTGREATLVSKDGINLLAYYVIVAKRKFDHIQTISAFDMKTISKGKETIQ